MLASVYLLSRRLSRRFDARWIIGTRREEATNEERGRERGESCLIKARAAVLIRVDRGVIIRELDTERTRLFWQLGTEKVSRTRREISFTRRSWDSLRSRMHEDAQLPTKYFIICNYNSCAVNFHSCEAGRVLKLPVFRAKCSLPVSRCNVYARLFRRASSGCNFKLLVL